MFPGAYSCALTKASPMLCSTPILVNGNLFPVLVRFDRFTFSPKANLMNFGALSINISLALLPHFNLIKALCPPIGLADPCKSCAEVTPSSQLSIDIDVPRVNSITNPDF